MFKINAIDFRIPSPDSSEWDQIDIIGGKYKDWLFDIVFTLSWEGRPWDGDFNFQAVTPFFFSNTNVIYPVFGKIVVFKELNSSVIEDFIDLRLKECVKSTPEKSIENMMKYFYYEYID